MKSRVKTHCLSLSLLLSLLLGSGAGSALGPNAEAETYAAPENEPFAGTLFFTPEQRLTSAPPSEHSQSAETSLIRAPADGINKSRTIRLSFDGLMHHRGQQVVWINGRPLNVQVLPRGLRSVVFDAERELLAVALFDGGVYRLAIGECLLSGNQIENCSATRSSDQPPQRGQPEGANPL